MNLGPSSIFTTVQLAILRRLGHHHAVLDLQAAQHIDAQIITAGQQIGFVPHRDFALNAAKFLTHTQTIR
jgi:hypothetical protein